MVDERNKVTSDDKRKDPDPTDRPFPQGDELRKNYPGTTQNKRGGAPDMDVPDNFDNAGRDQQQIADDNISQYTTGKPV